MVTMEPYEKWPDSRVSSKEKGTQVKPEQAVEMNENPVDNETRPATKEDVIAAIRRRQSRGGLVSVRTLGTRCGSYCFYRRGRWLYIIDF